MTQEAFTSTEMVRAIAVARSEAFEEAARIAQADHTPGYGSVGQRHADIIEFIAEKQRTDIADRIRFAALSIVIQKASGE